MDEKPINIHFYIISKTLELQSTIGSSTGPSNVVVIVYIIVYFIGVWHTLLKLLSIFWAENEIYSYYYKTYMQICRISGG